MAHGKCGFEFRRTPHIAGCVENGYLIGLISRGSGFESQSRNFELLFSSLFKNMAKKEKKFHYIYKTTNLVNGKYYIGMHSTDNLEDGYIGSGKRLWNAIKIFGKDKFKCEVLEMLPNRSSLKERERELVNEDVLKDKKCMNLQPGGGGGFVDEHHKQKFQKSGKRAVKLSQIKKRIEKKKKKETKKIKSKKIIVK